MLNVYFDEFDAFFHFELSEKIIQYIKEKYKDSLVIFTTHNTNLMSNKIMRPDTLFILSTSGKLTPLCKATDRELVIFQNMKVRSAKINYCPMCGKKLVMEVQDDTE